MGGRLSVISIVCRVETVLLIRKVHSLANPELGRFLQNDDKDFAQRMNETYEWRKDVAE